MRLIAVLAGAGYAYMMLEFGWVGAAAAALHIVALLLFVKR